MKEAQRRRIMVTSSLNKISINQLGKVVGEGEACDSSRSYHLRSRLLDRYLHIDDVNGFFSTSDIFASWEGGSLQWLTEGKKIWEIVSLFLRQYLWRVWVQSFIQKEGRFLSYIMNCVNIFPLISCKMSLFF